VTAARRLARPPPLAGRGQARLLGLLAVASFFEGYDLNVVMVALPAIRHSFGLSQAQAADWIAVLFLGALPDVFIARRARPPYRRLLIPVCAAAALGSLLTQPFVFVIDFMQTQRHLPAPEATLILVGAGLLAIPVLASAGAASDRLGRKRIGCSFLALSIAGTLCFFLLARSPAGLFAALTVSYVGQFGAWPTLGGLSTELFPTRYRALARSVTGTAAIAGQSGSFLLAGELIGLTGSFAGSVTVLATGPAAALAIVATCCPETAGRDLEEPVRPAA
jgi:MFS family permease